MKRRSAVLRRLEAGIFAAGLLWTVSVTAGSKTIGCATRALRESLPLGALRWELGDFWVEDTLSPAAVLTLREAPLLLTARADIAALRQAEEAPEAPKEAEPETVTVPVEETPLDSPTAPDNGIPAKTLVPTDPSGYVVCGQVYISNATDHVLSIQELQKPFAAEPTEGEPQILILHTHGSEAYTPAEDSGIVWSGDHRTTDSRYNVVAVGDTMAAVFAEAGFSVLHDRTLYDYPSYSDAYDRSLSAIESYLTQYPSIRFILDIHRDAIADEAGTQYKVVSDTAAGTAAQLTLVVGSDGSGLSHPDWMENLRLAAAIQAEAAAEHPTLMRPLLLRNSRYNQHATSGSLLVEVGAAGNSPEEAALAGQLFAKSMVSALESRNK